MSATHVTVTASWDGEKLHLDDSVAFYASLRRMKPEQGEVFVVRVERPEDALTAGQRRYYFGRVLQPFCEYTGYRKDELHEMAKADCLPDGKVSITQLNHEEMRDFIEAVEQRLREALPEAFALYERGVA